MNTLGSPLAQIKASGSHHEIGEAVGKRFATHIQRALNGYRFLHDELLPYHQTPEGQARYATFLELHRRWYPDYVTELEGLAQGAGCAFEELFLVNLRGEYRGLLHTSPPRGCSDCVLVTDEKMLIGHNEDGAPAFQGHVYLVHAEVEGKPAFTAFSYPGFLCGNAFGFNAEGICFSVDNVQPRNVREGVGRHFIARSLLEARSLDDAIRRVTVPARASGFSYTIGSIPERQVVIVEVAPEAHRIRAVQGTYFHTNHYLELTEVDQVIHPSSQARIKRGSAMMQTHPLRHAGDILTILGDQADEQYPIYRSATPPDQSMTLCTALFDLGARRLRIYVDHPIRHPASCIELDM